MKEGNRIFDRKKDRRPARSMRNAVSPESFCAVFTKTAVRAPKAPPHRSIRTFDRREKVRAADKAAALYMYFERENARSIRAKKKARTQGASS